MERGPPQDGEVSTVKPAQAGDGEVNAEPPCTALTHSPGENILSFPLFIAGNGGTATKFKKAKVKQKVQKLDPIKPGDPPSILIHGNGVGETRKMLDAMLIDGGRRAV